MLRVILGTRGLRGARGPGGDVVAAGVVALLQHHLGGVGPWGLGLAGLCCHLVSTTCLFGCCCSGALARSLGGLDLLGCLGKGGGGEGWREGGGGGRQEHTE
jgi:hypothetical protein